MRIDRRFCALGALALAVSVSACTPNDINMGASAKHNYALQVVNPEPVYANPIPATDGAQAAGSQDRYRTDKVKKPVSAKTTQGGSGGGGNSSSGGSN
jgi:type IV pilus biogenesis protein CpaD/CtpE